MNRIAIYVVLFATLVPAAYFGSHWIENQRTEVLSRPLRELEAKNANELSAFMAKQAKERADFDRNLDRTVDAALQDVTEAAKESYENRRTTFGRGRFRPRGTL